MAKRVAVVPVARLPLQSKAAIHKLKLLAGVRWTPLPPADGGVSAEERELDHGFIKIACEDFPKPQMNLKWISDTIDRLVLEANVCSPYSITNPSFIQLNFTRTQDTSEKFIDIPVDTRHIAAKARKAKKGEHYSGRLGPRPSIRDFPKEWLPAPSSIAA